MQSKLRKVLAVLATLAMLCTLLPLSVISVSAAENLAPSFSNWFASNANDAAVAVEGNSLKISFKGNYGWAGFWANVEQNTEYTLTYRIKGSQAGRKTITQIANADWSPFHSVEYKEGDLLLGTEWVERTTTFNSGSNSTILVEIQSGHGSTAWDAWVDNVVLTVAGSSGGSSEPTTPSVPPLVDMNWEDGVAVFNGSTTVVAEGPNGSNCLKWEAAGGWSLTRIYVDGVEKNTEYIIKFKMKTSAAKAINLTIENRATAAYYHEPINPTTEWAEYTIVTNVGEYAGDNGQIRLKFQDGGDAQTVWIDDLTMTKVVADDPENPDQPAAENLIVNGDFETGDFSNWEKHQSTVISSAAAHDGSYGANLKGNGSWNGLLNQSFSVQNNATYDISLWYKVIKNGFTLQIIGNQSTTKYHNKSYKTVGDWTHLTVTVTVSGDTSVKLNFSGIGGSGSADASKAEDVYIDSITVTKQKSASYDGYIYDGDFELNNLTANWTAISGATAELVGGYTGKYAMSAQGGLYCQVRQKVSVVANTDYSITLWAKNASNMALKLKTGVDDQNLPGGQKTITAGSTWTKITFEFNSGNNTSLYVGLMGTAANAAAIIDDISMVVVKDPSYDGFIYNGDFEAGSLVKWNSYSGTTLSTDAAKNGKYGVIVKGSGDWGGLLNQDFTLEAGKTYKLSFWYKNIKTGVNVVIRDYDRQDPDNPRNNLKVAGNYLSNKTDWTLYEVTFKSGYSTNVYLNFSGSGENAGDEMWVDDIKIENLSGDEMDRLDNLKNSGTSIRDVDDNNRGLAFRFFVNVNGAQVVKGNEYVPGTGSMKLFEYADTMGTMIEAGAIVTNDAAKGAAGLTMDSVDNAKTIKITAKYLTDLSETDMGFAVRVVNIPDYGVDTEIYARPYYTYQIGDQQVTVYGDTVNESYAHASSVRRSLKVLAIGNSFSVDAMENHLYDVLKSAEYDQVILGNLYIGGCSLNTHWNNISNGLTTYEFHKNDDNGTWVKTNGYNVLTALREETWDIITIQQASPDSGKPETYTNLQNIVRWIHQNKTNPNAKVMWHMTWAYQQNSTHEAFPSYGSNQMTMYNAIVNAAQNTAMKVEGIDGIIPSGTAIQNLRGTALGDTLTADGYHLSDTYGDYTAALTWFRAITGESLDSVDYVPDSVANHSFNIKRAVGHAVSNPYAITDLSETVLIAGSDFQANTWDKNIANVNGILGGIQNTDGYKLFDGMLFPGDFTPDQDHDASTIGIGVLDEFSNEFVIGNKVYSEGNHDAPTVELLSPYGNNDPLNGTYGVFAIHEADFGQFGGGNGQKVGNDLKEYFDEKIESGWDLKKPIFVMTHVPLHFNWRTISDNGAGKNAHYIVDALNYGGEQGFNIIFLFGHNHSADYDAYLGGGSIYLAKGDTMLIAKPENFKEYQEVELKFTYMNAGYVGYFYKDCPNLDRTLTMTTFKIQADGSVIITRYDENGYHNLKAQGVPHNPNNHIDYIPLNEDVYGPQRIVTATSDEEYTG